MSVRPRLLFAIAVALVAAACGDTSASPTPVASATAVPSPSAPATPCGEPLAAAARVASGHVHAAAALLSAKVVVLAGTNAVPHCFQLAPGGSAHIMVGDSVEFVANAAPNLSPATGVVTVTTRPGPTETGPGGLATAHSIIRLTAVAAGTVTVTWMNCSGTGC